MACSTPVPVYCDVASGPSTPSHSLSCVELELQLGYQLTGLCGREGKSDQLLLCRTGPATHCWWQLLPHTAVVCSSTTSNFHAARVRPTSHATCVADSPTRHAATIACSSFYHSINTALAVWEAALCHHAHRQCIMYWLENMTPLSSHSSAQIAL